LIYIAYIKPIHACVRYKFLTQSFWFTFSSYF